MNETCLVESLIVKAVNELNQKQTPQKGYLSELSSNLLHYYRIGSNKSSLKIVALIKLCKLTARLKTVCKSSSLKNLVLSINLFNGLNTDIGKHCSSNNFTSLVSFKYKQLTLKQNYLTIFPGYCTFHIFYFNFI